MTIRKDSDCVQAYFASVAPRHLRSPEMEKVEFKETRRLWEKGASGESIQLLDDNAFDGVNHRKLIS